MDDVVDFDGMRQFAEETVALYEHVTFRPRESIHAEDLLVALDTVNTLTRRVEELEGGWQPIETAPQDGSWILICCERDGADSFEVGRFDPMFWVSFEEVESGLYRKVSEPMKNCSWHGINNFHRATHWRPLPTPPKGEDNG